ncbi:unnamed protein product [Prunus armeniaca]|uniref:Transposase MuDR plant domain-containing protein n=1 Tax=Prunus armeniaca TaxID=36596 RepID=A0A6J5TL12_PRUAR|nr:unnamed protein product [Prunus armeniaca]
MYHGGQICGNCYASGNVAWFDYCDKDRMSKADIVPNRGVVIEELDDNYGAIVPVGGKRKQWRQQKKSVVIEELNEYPNGEQSGGGTQKPRESCARQGVSEKGKEKAVERESSAVQEDKEKVVERESSATVDKGKSKVSSVFGKRRARAFCKRRCKYVKKTHDKEDQRSNTVTEGLVEKEVVEGSVEKIKLSRCHLMKTRKARKMTTFCDDKEESADSLDSNFADPNFSCDDNDDDVDFDEWVDKQTKWVGDGAKGKESMSTNAGFESWDWGADVELDLEEYDSDNVQPKYDSDDDTPMTDKWPEFNMATNMADPQFEVGMKFIDCKVFRLAVKEQFIKRNKDVVFVRSEAFKLNVVCAYPDCPWEIYAFKMQHEKTLQSNPSWPVSSFMEMVEKDYNTGVSRQQVYRAKERAFRQIEGIYTEQYSIIWDYCKELRKTNPGTTTKVQCDFNEQLGHPVFQRLYVCLGACKAGFIVGCRPIIGLDGYFLKGVYGGHFLAAIGIYANNETWVIVYAVVEFECKDSWVWFLELLMEELKNLDKDAYAWLTKPEKPPRHWSRSHFSTHVKCDMLLNSRRDKMKNWIKEIFPKIFKKVEINKAKAGGCVTMWSSGGKFQVGSGGISQYIVDLDLRTCSCKEWDLTGWPYVHGVLWDRTNMPPCVPHSYSKQPERPRNARRKEAGECSKKANVVTKVQDSLNLLFVSSSQQTTQTSEVGPSTKTRRAKPTRSVHKGKWKRKATIVAGSSNAPPTNLAAPSSTSTHPASGSTSLATGYALPTSTEASIAILIY